MSFMPPSCGMLPLVVECPARRGLCDGKCPVFRSTEMQNGLALSRFREACLESRADAGDALKAGDTGESALVQDAAEFERRDRRARFRPIGRRKGLRALHGNAQSWVTRRIAMSERSRSSKPRMLLRGDVESRGRLVCDDKLRLHRERHCDHDALRGLISVI